jgi:hypothetical protein
LQKGGEGIRTLINSLTAISSAAGERITALPPHPAPMFADVSPFKAYVTKIVSQNNFHHNVNSIEPEMYFGNGRYGRN